MTQALFTQAVDTAFEEVVGARGAARASYTQWRDKLSAILPRIEKNPVPEAANIFGLATATEDLAEIESIATHIAEHFTDLVVVGMGGSSLSGEALAHLRKPGGVVLHIVDNIDPHTLALLVEALPWKTTAFLVISKSGNTVETHAQMAVFLREAKARGANPAKQFFMITITNNNPLHRMATEYGMRVVGHDPDMCGRFSILSAVGLIPAAAMGVDIRGLRSGAQITLAENFTGVDPSAADAAALHMALMEKSANIHVLMHYCDRLGGLAAWVRQSWAESLGKAGKGTIPVPSRGATDQHSQLQLYLEGPKDKFFTSLIVDTSGQGAGIGFADTSTDARLSYLNGHTLGDLAMAEQRATNVTLVKAGCPLRTITASRMDEATLGALLMHFALEVVFTAELLGVNAFDQPAVESSKKLALAYLSGK
jgi:glucose-6-phosphate isomerase